MTERGGEREREREESSDFRNKIFVLINASKKAHFRDISGESDGGDVIIHTLIFGNEFRRDFVELLPHELIDVFLQM